MSQQAEQFVFWVQTEPAAVRRAITRCTIDPTGVVWHQEPVVLIPMKSIQQVERGRKGGHLNPIDYVLIETADDKIELFPINPFAMPRPPFMALYEAQAMYEVLNSLRRGLSPTHDSNPYIRQQVLQGRKNITRDWDSNTSPLVYYNQGKIGIKPWKVLVALALAFLVMMAILYSFDRLATFLSGGIP